MKFQKYYVSQWTTNNKGEKNPKSWLLAHNQQGGPILSYY
jgi:hypothetical protein